MIWQSGLLGCSKAKRKKPFVLSSQPLEPGKLLGSWEHRMCELDQLVPSGGPVLFSPSDRKLGLPFTVELRGLHIRSLQTANYRRVLRLSVTVIVCHSDDVFSEGRSAHSFGHLANSAGDCSIKSRFHSRQLLPLSTTVTSTCCSTLIPPQCCRKQWRNKTGFCFINTILWLNKPMYV